MNLPSKKMKQLSTARVLSWLLGLMVVLYAQALVAQSDAESGDAVVAGDTAMGWKTYRHDNRRSGVTSLSLDFPLASRWVHRSGGWGPSLWGGLGPFSD